MVQIAKRTQSKVKELAAKVDHVQVPAYYDQIVGDLYLVPEGAALRQGQRRFAARRRRRRACCRRRSRRSRRCRRARSRSRASPAQTRGWMVNVSLPEAATQFGYRVGDKGDFTDAGLLDVLDQRTGARMPKTYFEMAPDQGKTTIYVTWRDKRGEQADVFPINFDPTGALADEQKKILEQFWTSWIAFREFNGHAGLFHPPRHLSLRHQGSALRLRRRRRSTRCSSFRLATPPTRTACRRTPRSI